MIKDTASTEQIMEMRKILEGCAGYWIAIDNENILDSFNYFIIWDDSNRLLYAIASNTTIDAEYYAPFKIKSFDYDWIQSIAGLFQGEIYNLYEKEV